MANKTIPDLTEATLLNDADWGIISQSAVTKKIAGSILKNADKVDGFHASATPAASIAAVTDTGGKLAVGFFPASATPTADTIPIAGADGKIAVGWLPSVAFSANKNAVNQTILTATFTKVTFITEDYDEGSYYDAVNSKFTPPSGYYHIDVSFGWSSDGGLLYCMLYKNGVLHKGNVVYQGTGEIITNQISCDVIANGTDYFEVYAWQDTGSSKTISGATAYAFFHAHKI